MTTNRFDYPKTFTMKGETLTLTQWAKRFDVDVNLVRDRVFGCAWPLLRALTEPVMSNGERHAKRKAKAALIAKLSAAFGPRKTVRLRFPARNQTRGDTVV